MSDYMRMEESDFYARCNKNIPVNIISKDWVNNCLIVTFEYIKEKE